jgi:hypothetical protein
MMIWEFEMVGGSMTISRLARRLGWLAFAGVLFCGCLPAQAQQFSAEIMIMKDDGASAPAGKVYVAGGKERLETPEHTDGFFVIDGAAPSAYFVQPSARQFMDARQSSRLTRLFVPVDPDNPCLQWESMARLAGVTDQGAWHCERVGQETIDGSSAIAYRVVSAPGRELLGWVDPMRKFPLRVKTEDGAVFEVGNLHDQPQAAELFEVPTNFRKFDPQALINRIKQSDVWVENRERHGGP